MESRTLRRIVVASVVEVSVAMTRCLLALAVGAFFANFALADYLVIKVDVNKGLAANSGQGGVLSSKPGKGHKGGRGHMGPGASLPGGSIPKGDGSQDGMPGTKIPGMAMPGMGDFGGNCPGGSTPTGQTQTGKNVDTMPPRWACAYLELRGRTMPIFTNYKVTHIAIEHAWGKHTVVPIENVLYIQKDSRGIDFAKRALALSKEGKAPAKSLDLARRALAHGLMKEFHATMEDLNKARDIRPPLKSSLEAYLKVKERLPKPPAGADPAQVELIKDLQRENYQAIASPQGHFNLLTNIPVTGEGVQQRLSLLEETYEKFFYWFALHSPEWLPAMPGHRLLAVLVSGPKEFQNKHIAWGSLPLVGDGFLPRRDNVLVMSPEHLGETYGLLKRNNQSYSQSLRMGSDELLNGTVWKRPDAQQNDINVALLQTLTLVQKATHDEAERATISHLATRQLLFATGLLPRNVAVPEWIQYGLSSFFETPPNAFYPGLGIPSWSNLIDFKCHRRTLGSPRDVLWQVVSDAYFQRARQSAARYADRADSETLANKAREDMEIARATSWALVYYLMRENKLHYLKNFSLTLDSLPRDLDLSERTLRTCFARACASGDNSDLHHQVQRLADAWFSEMDNYVLEILQFEQYVLQARLGLESGAFQAPYGGQRTCPVRGEELGAHGPPVPVTVRGQTIYVCCEGCVRQVQDDPDRHLYKVAQERGRLGGDKQKR